jgi:hypothetical protein
VSANEHDDDRPDSEDVIDRLRALNAKLEAALENADAIFSALETERPVFAYDWGVGRTRAIIRDALKAAKDKAA